MKSAFCVFDGKTGIHGNDGRRLTGAVTFDQVKGGVKVDFHHIAGFKRNDIGTKHGVHVHAMSSTGNECADAGGHYNPDFLFHGGPKSKKR